MNCRRILLIPYCSDWLLLLHAIKLSQALTLLWQCVASLISLFDRVVARVGSWITAPGSETTWDRDQQFIQGSGYTTFVGSGSKICQDFGYKSEISMGNRMGPSKIKD